MENLLYLVELPGKNAEPLVVSCDSVTLSEGIAAFWRNPPTSIAGVVVQPFSNVLIAAFAPGRWVSVKLGVAKPKDGAAA